MQVVGCRLLVAGGSSEFEVRTNGQCESDFEKENCLYRIMQTGNIFSPRKLFFWELNFAAEAL